MLEQPNIESNEFKKGITFPTAWELINKLKNDNSSEDSDNGNDKEKYEWQDFDMGNVDFDRMYENTLNKGSNEVKELLKDVLITNVFKGGEIPADLSFERTETDNQKKIIIHEGQKRYILTGEGNKWKYLETGV